MTRFCRVRTADRSLDMMTRSVRGADPTKASHSSDYLLDKSFEYVVIGDKSREKDDWQQGHAEEGQGDPAVEEAAGGCGRGEDDVERGRRRRQVWAEQQEDAGPEPDQGGGREQPI